MKFQKTMAILFCVTLMISVTACSKNKHQNGSIPSTVQSSSSLVPQGASSSASTSASSKSISSASNGISKKQATSKISSGKFKNDNEWVTYIDDNHNLHIKRKDGTNNKIIVKDVEEAPCVAGEWVYFFPDLDEIDKVKLDGSQRTKVCGTDAMDALNGNMSITADYKNGYILYITQQCHEVGNNSSYPAHYYKLDPDTNKITEVKSN